MPKIPFINPTFPSPDEVSQDLKQIYKRNYYSNNGPVYHQFKSALEKYLGNSLHICVTANATLAIMLAIRALMQKDKKEVLVPAFTFAAGPLAIKWAGFEPVLIDINLEDLQPDYEQATAYLKENNDSVAGILLCNSFGVGNEQIERWEKLAKTYNQPLVIDSAAGFGTRNVDGKLLGANGDCEIFSFHATKPFGIGEGGAICSSDPELIERLERNKNFGFDEKNNSQEQGLNAKITELDCAIGLRLLPKLDQKIATQQLNRLKYLEKLEPLGMSFLKAEATSAIQFVTAILPLGWDRDELIDKLKLSNIETKKYYNPAIHHMPAFSNVKRLELKNTDEICQRVISLPMSAKLTESEIDSVISVIDSYSSH